MKQVLFKMEEDKHRQIKSFAALNDFTMTKLFTIATLEYIDRYTGNNRNQSSAMTNTQPDTTLTPPRQYTPKTFLGA